MTDATGATGTTGAGVLQISRQAWAWEFLRVNAAYDAHARAARTARQGLRASPALTVLHPRPDDLAERWGLVCFEHPDRAYANGAVAWRPEVDPGILPVSAVPAPAGVPGAVDFRRLGVDVSVIVEEGAEHVLLLDGGRSLQLWVRAGSVLGGPVRLVPAAFDARAADQKRAARRGLNAFLRTGEIPPAPSPGARRTYQWLAATRVYPLTQVGLNDWQIAEISFPAQEGARLADMSAWARSHVHRARQLGAYLVGGGFLKILSRGNSDRIPGQPEPVRAMAFRA